MDQPSVMTNLNFRVVFICLGLVAASTGVPAWGAGATGEEEALAALNNGHYPVALSTDGRWIVHVDAHNVLYRKRVADLKTVDSIDLSMSAKALSASRTGTKVAFVTGNACVGIASFSSNDDVSQPSAHGSAPSLTWLGSFLNDPHNSASCSGLECCPIEKSNQNYDENWFGAFAVALSSDGALIAVAGSPIRVFDVATKQMVYEIPTGGLPILHLRFVDADRKLFVVQALMGEQWESAATGSDMQFAVWDLQRKELFNFHKTGTAGTLLHYDLLWGFSETTGELWAINTNGQYWEPDPLNPESGRLRQIRPYSTNLKRCAVSKRSGLSLPPVEGDGWLDFAADPLGRYVAGVSPTFNNKLQRATSTVWVRDSRTGKILVQWHLNDELRALTTTKDGNFIYGVTAGQPKPDQLSYTRYGWTFSGGGELKKFDLSSKIAALPLVEALPWPEKSCLLEDEVPHARDVLTETQKITRVFEIPLEEHLRQTGCNGDEVSIGRPGNSLVWQQLSDGMLLVDRWSHIYQIDPENGRVLQRIPTPRTPMVCSLPLYEQKQFLSWQGDTVTLRPFAETLASGDRKVLAKKPGWLATQVELLGNRFGVRWLDSRHKDEDVTEHNEGSAIAIAYDMSGRKLGQVSGHAASGRTYFPSEDNEGGEYVFAEYVQKPLQKGAYRWERSYMNSVRAYRRDSVTNDEQTVLWAGLRFDKSTKMAPSRNEPDNGGDVVDLADAHGAYIDSSSVKVYDAAGRRLRASIKVKNVRNVAWNPVNRILVIETFKLMENRPNVWKLSGYRFD